MDVPTLDAVAAAARASRPLVQQTPVRVARGISEMAWNRVRQLPAHVEEVVAASSGNFAVALALAAAERGLRATVFVPADMLASLKVDKARGFGAQIRSYRRGSGERDGLVAEFAERTGATAIKSSNDPDVIVGQATVAYEFLQQAPGLEALLVPAAGGGLLAGTASVAAAHVGVRVFGVEPTASDDLARSLRTGNDETAAPQHGDSIADALLLETAAPNCLALCRQLLPSDAGLVVSEAGLRRALHLLSEEGVFAEPSAAAGVAALIEGLHVPAAGSQVGVVVTGSNVDPELHRTLCQEGQ